ncbi:MAG: nickel pincer cofactor biosynthesis protein LarC [Bacillati bacterium ANGP1]|uniref:Putative nickel insertion protein n=1 Tax=Candidatus Segetimicrobium genomatis TaxID=2569760 RepID=A0A537JBT0_9BACT|nr:MAG: nickel pincer cofactor biosynthesis protein LarC [Terrabacteria group bacterium ANGP1]
MPDRRRGVPRRSPPGRRRSATTMRIGYLDCASGASGDMLLGGVPVRITVGRVHRQSVPAVRVEVQETEPPHSRRYPVLARVLADAPLDPAFRDSAAVVLRRLAAAEAEIHATPIEEVHLHELGGVDTLVDIVGVLAGVRALNLDRLIASPVNLGRGWAKTGHGTVPVPAPATSALIAGMPVYAGEFDGELLTPTGAVLLSSLVTRWGALPLMRLERIGTGAGAADPPRANAAPSDEDRAERLAVLETSIDDMNPQLYPHVTARLLDAGALDVMTIPAVMKKGRPGHLLRVLAVPDRVRALYGILLAETTTLGVRVYEVSRLAARRRRVEVQTEYGAVPIKIAEDRSGVLNMAPEFDVCRALAERHGVPLKRVLAAAQRAAEAIEPRVLRG